jgi:flavin reductase (DIM6/NTAB) family NADH-FMN oxidoreductase RutF
MTSSNRIPAQGEKMARPRRKTDLPVSEIRRYLEPGPIVLVTSAHGDERNIMTMGWHTVMEFTPSLSAA